MKTGALGRKTLKKATIYLAVISACFWAILGALLLKERKQTTEAEAAMVLIGKLAFCTWLLSVVAAGWGVKAELQRSRQVLLDEASKR